MKKWFLYTVAGVALAVVALSLALPSIIDKEAKKIVKQNFGLTLAYDELDFSLAKLSLGIKGLKLSDANSSETLLSFKSLDVNISYSTLALMRPIVNSVVLAEPVIHLSKDASGKFNFEKHLPPKKKETTPTKETLFELKEFHVKNATLSVKDSTLGLDEKFEKINVDGFGISNTEEGKKEFATINTSAEAFGGTIAKQTKIKLFDKSLPFEQKLQISGIDIERFAKFLPKDIKKLSGKIEVNTSLSGTLANNIKIKSDGKAALKELKFEGFGSTLASSELSVDHLFFENNKSAKVGKFEIKALEIAKKDAGIDAKLQSFELKELNASLSDKNIHISKITADKLLLMILKAKQSSKVGKKSEASSDGEKGKKWDVAIDEFELKDSKVAYQDKTLPKELKAQIENINLKITNIAPTKDTNTHLALGALVQKSGKVAIAGDVNILKKSANLSVDMSGIPLKPLDTLGLLPPKLSLSGGAFSTKGTLAALFDEKYSQFAYKGKAGIQKFALFENSTNQKLVGFDTMGVNGINFSDKERRATVSSITFDGLFADIKIDKQRRLNLMAFAEGSKSDTNKTTAAKTDTKKPFYYSIGSVVLQNGNIKFEDEHIKPNYQADLTKVSGRVTTIKPNMDTVSDVQLIGTFNNQGQIDIKGSFIPNPKNFYLTLKSEVRDIGLPSFTTYSSKYIGYEIESGALGLELDYQIVGKDLTSNNKISLFGFNLGNEVENPTAKKLPYKLALAILKDSKGNIDIELPVEGTTDDPNIRSGKVVWKLISQLVTKIITAPFKFIGSLFGGGEEMGYVEFGYGVSDIDKKEDEKLAKVAQMLKQKSELKVEVEGFVDGEKDSIRLKDLAFDKKLAVQKLRDQKKSEKEWQKTVIEPKEYEKYLLKAYKAEEFPKPSNFLGFEKSVPSEDMKNLILTHILITTDNTDMLASERAQNVVQKLIGLGVDKSRIAVAKSSGAPEQKEKIKSSRVELRFGLK